MSDGDTMRVRRNPDGTVVQLLEDGTAWPLHDPSDWARVDALTEAEVEANALADPDNPPVSAERLERLRLVPQAKAIRQRLNLTQEEFAARFQLRLGTIRDWEQGLKRPDRAAQVLLRVIEKHPEAVLSALAEPVDDVETRRAG